MLTLFSNSLRKEISYDLNQGNNYGTIYFVSGDVYEGELYQGNVSGIGKLTLVDGSRYEGTFSKNQFKRGIYHHYTGIKIEGKFKKERLDRGVIYFLNGSYLKGKWEDKNGKRVLKSGQIFDHNNLVIKKFHDEESY